MAKEAKKAPAWAVVRLGGCQQLVKVGDELIINRLKEEGKEPLSLENVLLCFDGQKVNIGQPRVLGAEVEAEILAQEKGKKVEVRRFKAKSRYRRKKGHRQLITRIRILDVRM